MIKGPGKATHQETRAHNSRLVLGTVYDRGPISRATVARATGLTRTTVSDVVGVLLADGLVREIGRGPSTGGRAPVMLEVTGDARHLIGLDLGEKVFRGAIVDLRGRVVSAIEVEVEDRDGQGALEQVFGLVDRLMAASDRPVLGIGIGTAGLIDTTVGTVLEAVNLDWHDLPLGSLLRARTGLPVYVANDSQATALAEHVFGGPRTSNLVVVKVGEGVGAGVVLEGRLFQGDGFGAGEIGHTTIRPGGDPCRCGRNGCLETVSSTRAILRRLAPSGITRLPDAVAALQAGDPDVHAAVIESGREIGVAVAWLVGALNIDRVVLVGGAAEFGEPWLDAVRDTMRHSALGRLASATTVEISAIRDDVVLGASALLMTQELGLRLSAQPLDTAAEMTSGDAAVDVLGVPA
ncbi:MAG TPA: ROK family transcriptional regulator [Candidatus Limnocylindrales bacterium]|nr:ROK family transcriptional regulator [Candidatus Limnocylindrales bacterium]